eukprot:GHVT01066069.1.p1 GENE.GHVT01066069.1~~GHVT01066069.1.p1  ORF type:complete len:453 (+),score=87.22 GHVT01066069.1:75-1361(+)
MVDWGPVLARSFYPTSCAPPWSSPVAVGPYEADGISQSACHFTAVGEGAAAASAAASQGVYAAPSPSRRRNAAAACSPPPIPPRGWRSSSADGSICCLHFAASGHRVAAGEADGVMRLWDVTPEAVKLRAALYGHVGAVNVVAFHPHDDVIIASGGEDGTVRVWDLKRLGRPSESGRPAQSRPRQSSGTVRRSSEEARSPSGDSSRLPNQEDFEGYSASKPAARESLLATSFEAAPAAEVAPAASVCAREEKPAIPGSVDYGASWRPNHHVLLGHSSSVVAISWSGSGCILASLDMYDDIFVERSYRPAPDAAPALGQPRHADQRAALGPLLPAVPGRCARGNSSLSQRPGGFGTARAVLEVGRSRWQGEAKASRCAHISGSTKQPQATTETHEAATTKRRLFQGFARLPLYPSYTCRRSGWARPSQW